MHVLSSRGGRVVVLLDGLENQRQDLKNQCGIKAGEPAELRS